MSVDHDLADPQVAVWSAALDEIEAGLAADPTTPLTWDVPSTLGPLPQSLAPRAERVLAAVDAVHAELAASAAVVLEELDGLGTSTAATTLGGVTHAAGAARRRPHATDDPPAPRLVDHDA